MTDAYGSLGEAAGLGTPIPVVERNGRGCDEHARMVGRGDLLARAHDHLADGGSVVFTGPAGIGKSMLLSALAAGSGGDRVLRCSPAEAEAHLPFLGLIDLLSEAAEDVLPALPGHQRSVLEAALLRRIDPVDERDVLGLRLAVLAAVRALCARTPVLLVIDDVQWLDPPSEELLAFIARRTTGPGLRAAVSLRMEPAERHRPIRLCPPPALTLPVPPMTVTEVARLLGDLPLSRSVVTRLHHTCGGNPFFALELGRMLVERGEPVNPAAPLPVPESLRCLMLGRLRALSRAAQRTLLTAGAAARPTVTLLRSAGHLDAAADIAEAVADGIVVAHDDRVHFTHPLLWTVLYGEASPQERLRCHTALADAVTDPVERARHLALVSHGRNTHVATTLSEAATAARRRGAPATAARLGLMAADRTPSAEPTADRRLTAAEDAVAAGEFAMARTTAREVLARSTEATNRVRAWIIILDSCGQALAEVDDVFPQALADARDDPALLAQLHYRLAWRAWLVNGSIEEARTEAARSATLAARAGDRRTEILALTKQASAEFHLGRPQAERTLTSALAQPRDARVMFDHNGPAYLRYRHHLLHDRLDEAHTELRSLVYAVRQRGAVESLFVFLRGFSEIEAYRGRCERALDLAHQALDLAEDSELSRGPAWCAIAFAEAAGGAPDRAVAAAELAVRHSEDDADLIFLPTALHALGHARLVRGDVEAAAEALSRVRGLEAAQGLTEPALRRWHADLAEALARTGRFVEAAELIAETGAKAARLGRHSVLAVLDRSAALVTAGRGDLDGAAARLGHAAAALGRLPFTLEEGRTRLELGRVHRRRGAGREARAALSDARRIFSRAGAEPWLAATNAELDALDLAPVSAPSHDGDALRTLSGVERRVAALVAEGATNREIAGRLFVSVKTVEAALTRTYRKLGVRSRVDVARLAMSPQEGTASRP